MKKLGELNTLFYSLSPVEFKKMLWGIYFDSKTDDDTRATLRQKYPEFQEIFDEYEREHDYGRE